jgi:hypothetical protein
VTVLMKPVAGMAGPRHSLMQAQPQQSHHHQQQLEPNARVAELKRGALEWCGGGAGQDSCGGRSAGPAGLV